MTVRSCQSPREGSNWSPRGGVRAPPDDDGNAANNPVKGGPTLGSPPAQGVAAVRLL